MRGVTARYRPAVAKKDPAMWRGLCPHTGLRRKTLNCLQIDCRRTFRALLDIKLHRLAFGQ